MSDAQTAAFAMAVYFRGMTWEECAAFTQAMARSGRVLDWSAAGLEGPILDKHSTGGVGDTVSLILAPLVAACGGVVPMISGRGLGHTGGTLDKLASIPGYEVTPDLDRFRTAVREAGCAIVGATADLAPADRRLYAIRDVTATTDSVPLITASILAKKLAAGLDALVMDVKVGSGAFAGSLASAQALAESLVTVAGDAGLRTVAWLTDMNQVLGHDVGNALEVHEAVDFLTGRRREVRLHAVTSALAREMLVLGGLARDHGEATGPVERALESGAAAERFARMVAALGGPRDLLERPDRHLPRAPIAAGRHARRRGDRRPGGRPADRARGDRAGWRPPAGVGHDRSRRGAGGHAGPGGVRRPRPPARDRSRALDGRGHGGRGDASRRRGGQGRAGRAGRPPGTATHRPDGVRSRP